MRRPGTAGRCGWWRSALVLALAAVLVPDSAVKSTEVDAGQGRPGRRRRPEPRRGVDPRGRLGRPPGRGHDPSPGRRPPAGRHEHPDRRRHGDRHPARLLGGHPGLRVEQDQRRALLRRAADASARPSATWSASSPTTSSSSRFPFFEAMVKDIGGIEVNNPIAFSDEYLKPKGFRPGRIHLGGYDAMAFSRIRHNLIARRLRPLGQPAARAARHPGQGPRQGGRRRASWSAGC